MPKQPPLVTAARHQSKAPPLTLAEYRTLTRHLPSPTAAQIDAFVNHVCNAHSWYKHLSMNLPGVPFWFYVDPSAGLGIVQRPDGSPHTELLVGHQFHYSSMPTDEYRAKFGSLAAAYQRSSRIRRRDPDGTLHSPADDAFALFDPVRQQFVGLPAEVVAAGTALATGIIHEAGPMWISCDESAGQVGDVFAAENGGEATLRRVRALLAAEDVNSGIEVLRLCEPEQARQRRGMVQAIERVLALIAGDDANAL